MTVTYFDPSALVKLFVDEHGAELVRSLWDSTSFAVTSRLSLPEVAAALAGARRNHVLTDAQLDAALPRWAGAFAQLRSVELTPAVAAEAAELSRTHALSGADAVHLASAVRLADAGVVMAVWDRRLHAGARALGLRVAPAELSA